MSDAKAGLASSAISPCRRYAHVGSGLPPTCREPVTHSPTTSPASNFRSRPPQCYGRPMRERNARCVSTGVLRVALSVAPCFSCLLEQNPAFGASSATGGTTSPAIMTSGSEAGGPIPGSTSEAATSGSTTSSGSSTTAHASSSSGGDSGSSGGSAIIEGLIAQYRFDDDWTDGVSAEAIAGHDATCNAPASTCPTAIETDPGQQAASFASGQYFRVMDDGSFEVPGLTLALWVRIDDPSRQSIWAKPLGSDFHNSWQLEYDLGSLSFTTSNSIEHVYLQVAFPMGTMIHVTAVWDGAVKSLYLNGAYVGQQAGTIAFDTHDILFGIDENSGVPTYPFIGVIDDARIYDRALTNDEILAVMNDSP